MEGFSFKSIDSIFVVTVLLALKVTNSFDVAHPDRQSAIHHVLDQAADQLKRGDDPC